MRTQSKTLLLIGLIACVLSIPELVQAQQRRPQPPQEKKYFDVYEPSQRQRTRRSGCLKDEEYYGAYCVKKCKAGYELVVGSKPAKCRSLTPLPVGQLPGPVRRETGTQPLPPRPPMAPIPDKPQG
jgi:hypothetical protein